MEPDIISRDEAREESGIVLSQVFAQYPLWTKYLNEFIALWIIENLNFFNDLPEGNFIKNRREFEEIIEIYWFSYQLKYVKKDLLDLKNNILSIHDADLENVSDISLDAKSILFKAWYKNIFHIVSNSAVEVFDRIKIKKYAPSFWVAIDVIKELEIYMRAKWLFRSMNSEEIEKKQWYEF